MSELNPNHPMTKGMHDTPAVRNCECPQCIREHIDRIRNRLNGIDNSLDRNDENLTRLQCDVKDNAQRINGLYEWTAKKSEELHWFEERLSALEASLKAHESGIDEYGNPLPDTFADRLRHVERKIFQLESDKVQKVRAMLEARNQPEAVERATPKCGKCGDTKLISVKDHGRTKAVDRLCPCVKVGDVVSADVANMLPVGSRIRQGHWLPRWYWELASDGVWMSEEGKLNGRAPGENSWEYTILRIGPPPVIDKSSTTDDPHPTTCSCPDCEPATVADFSLADLLADERLGPLVEVVLDCIRRRRLPEDDVNYMLFPAASVDALPPELLAAIEKV